MYFEISTRLRQPVQYPPISITSFDREIPLPYPPEVERIKASVARAEATDRSLIERRGSGQAEPRLAVATSNVAVARSCVPGTATPARSEQVAFIADGLPSIQIAILNAHERGWTARIRARAPFLPDR